MDLAANEKAVHADFFNGKDAGNGDSSLDLSVSCVCVLNSGVLCAMTDWAHGTGKPRCSAVCTERQHGLSVLASALCVTRQNSVKLPPVLPSSS